MPGLEEIDLFLLKKRLDSSGFKSPPPIPENPYVLSGLPRHQLDVQHMSVPMEKANGSYPSTRHWELMKYEIFAVPGSSRWITNTLKNKAAQGNTSPGVGSQLGSKFSVTPAQISCLCLFCAIQSARRRLIKAMTPLKSRPIAVCFSICWHSWFLHFAFCQISSGADRESLFSAGRLMQQVYEICHCVMDHCGLRLCSVQDKRSWVFAESGGVRSKELMYSATVS